MPVEVFAIDGLQVSGSGLRLAAFHATNGGNGVAMPDDLKVTALPVAGASVRVTRGQSGSAALVSRFPSAAGQTYLTLLPEAFEDIPVPATGSTAGVTRYVIQKITDPQYSGQTTGAQFELVSGAAGLLPPYDLGLAYPYVVLARIVQPASTATITPAMITDLRRLANPRQLREMRLIFPAGDKIMSKDSYTSWPFSGTMTSIEVPEWATKIDIVGHVSGAEITGAGVNYGGIRTVFDNVASTQNGIILGSAGRHSTSIIGSHPVSAVQRGKTLSLSLQGNQTGGTGGIQADYQTSIAVDWVFTEVPA